MNNDNTNNELKEKIKILESENQKLRKNKKYGLVWEQQLEDVKSNNLFLTNPKKNIFFHEKESNFLIQGDNLESLSILSFFNKKYDVIYIDPPYNTGGKDFRYNDKYVNVDDSFRHSKWLSFMEKRLRIARKLMTKDSAMFISIDDNEINQLKLLCNELFGEDNVKTIIWQKGNAQNDAKHLQKNHEYIIFCVKGNPVIQSVFFETQDVILKDGKYYYEKSGGITTGGVGGFLNARTNLGYSIYYNKITKDIIALDDYDKVIAKTSNNEKEIYLPPNPSLIKKGYECIRPKLNNGKLKCWTWGLEKFNKEKHRIKISDRNSITVLEEISSNIVFKEKEELKAKIEKRLPLKSIIDSISSGTGTKDFKKILPNANFANPKPVELIKYLVKSFQKKDAKVLDFFAGSGTTSQSVMELNAEDNGNRTFTVITNNENNICDEITEPRIRKCIENYKYKENVTFLKVEEKKTLKMITDKELMKMIQGVFGEEKPIEKTWGVLGYKYAILSEPDYVNRMIKELKKHEDITVYILSKDLNEETNSMLILKNSDLNPNIKKIQMLKDYQSFILKCFRGNNHE